VEADVCVAWPTGVSCEPWLTYIDAGLRKLVICRRSYEGGGIESKAASLKAEASDNDVTLFKPDRTKHVAVFFRVDKHVIREHDITTTAPQRRCMYLNFLHSTTCVPVPEHT
jgi:hypothetical protein